MVFICLMPFFISIILGHSGIIDEAKESLPKSYMLVLVYIWGFILIEQCRMRRKREKYGLVSGKTWNQFDIEDC